VTIEDDVFVVPGVVFTNDMRPRAANKKSHDELDPTLVRNGATLGAGAVVVCGSTVGATRSSPRRDRRARTFPRTDWWRGSRARLGWVCECGERLPDELRCSCGRAYVVVSETEGLASA